MGGGASTHSNSNPYHLSVLEKLHHAHCLNGLAADNTEKSILPEEIISAGYKAIDKLCEHLCGLFPENGVGCKLFDENMTKLIELFGLTELSPKIRPFIDDVLGDVSQFIKAMGNNLKKNPCIVTLGAEYMTATPSEAIDFSSFNTEEAKAELRQAVVYAALLDSLTYNFAFAEPPRMASNNEEVEKETKEKGEMFCQAMYRLVEEKFNKVNWKKYATAFEQMKFYSVPLMPEKKYMYGAFTPVDWTHGKRLQLNILEAIYQDVLQENEVNAAAGFEVMCQTSDQEDISCIGQSPNCEWKPDGKPTGLILRNIAMSEAWTNIYCSWNACFIAEYPEAALFFPKLTCTTVSGYPHDIHPGLFIQVRMITLWLHIRFIFLSRAEKENRRFTAIDWRHPHLISAWSQINRAAAVEYQKRVESTLEAEASTYKNTVYDVHRAMKWATYETVKTATIALREFMDIEEKVAEGFEKAMEAFEIGIESDEKQ